MLVSLYWRKTDRLYSGAAAEAVLEGIPSVAFSGATASQVSFTTLTSNPNSTSTRAALTYTTLTLNFVNALLDNPRPILPPGISVNVNYPSTANCPSPDNFSFVLTRLVVDNNAIDVETCGTNHLPDERSTIISGCFATVSVFNATTERDVGAQAQAAVLAKLGSILTCLPN